MNEQTRKESEGNGLAGQAASVAPVAALLDESEDFDLPVCTLRPGEAGFEGCEACQ